jgi:hypothetical protein
MSVDGRIAAGRFQQAGEHSDDRCFSGAVRPEQAEHFPTPDAEGYALDGGFSGLWVLFDKILYFKNE